jgi:predicted MPP superfamily phosphohydrolase
MERKSAPKLTRRSLLKCFGYGAATSIGTVGLADYSSRWLKVERHEIALPNWDATGFKVAVLSDFHSNRASDVSRSREALRIAIAENPDVIALPGDFIDQSSTRAIKSMKSALEPLHDANCPVVATMGNHDYWTNDPSRVIEGLQEMPLRLLRNEVHEVAGVTIAGIEDAIARRQRYDFLDRGRHSKSLLALFHEPDYVEEVPKHISLQVSGHSHGGQICLPGGFSVHTPYGAKRYISGYYPDARVPLYVTRGVGTTGPDMRLFCRPEVTILTLKSA